MLLKRFGHQRKSSGPEGGKKLISGNDSRIKQIMPMKIIRGRDFTVLIGNPSTSTVWCSSTAEISWGLLRDICVLFVKSPHSHYSQCIGAPGYYYVKHVQDGGMLHGNLTVGFGFGFGFRKWMKLMHNEAKAARRTVSFPHSFIFPEERGRDAPFRYSYVQLPWNLWQ